MDEQRKSELSRSPGQQFGRQETSASQSGSPGQKNQSGGRFGSAIADEAKEQGKHIGSEVKQEGQEIAGDLRHLAESYAQSGKENITGRLHHMSTALHRAADSLREEEEESTGRFADQAADQIDKVCKYIENAEPSDMMQSANRFAREQPFIVVGGLLLAGVMLGRFLRSSGRQTSNFDSQSRDFGQNRSKSSQDQSGMGPSGFGEPRRPEIGVGIGSSPGLRPHGDLDSPGRSAPGHIGSGTQPGSQTSKGTQIGSGRTGPQSGSGPGSGPGQSSSGSGPTQSGPQKPGSGGPPGSNRPLTSRPLTEPPREQGGPGSRGGA